MRTLVVLSLGAALVGTFFLGRLTKSTPAASASTGSVLTAHQGDAIHVPGIATRCIVSREARSPELLCLHTPPTRYEVVIRDGELFVYRMGFPDNPRFTAPWNP